MITTDQARLARTAVRMTVKVVAKELGVASNTVLKAERNIDKLNASTRNAIEAGYVRLGVEFLPDNGVRLKG